MDDKSRNESPSRNFLLDTDAECEPTVVRAPQRNIDHYLPLEVLSRILSIMRPMVNHDFRLHRAMTHFGFQSREYSQLRLVSSRWCDISTAFLFQEGILVTTPATKVEKIARFFDIRAPHLCSPLIMGEDDFSHQSYKTVSEAVGKGLNRCPKLSKLVCHGVPGPAFLNSRWISSFAPNLALTITSLVTTLPGHNVSHALVGLNQSLQSIVVNANNPLLSAFRLPNALPNLRHITWSDFVHQSQLGVLKKIIRLIPLDEGNNPLKSLRLNLNWARAPEILEILSIDQLGSGLTTLHIYCDQYSRLEDFAVNVLNICRNLVDFSYTSPFQKAALESLPPSIQYLQLLLVADDWGATAVDLVRILRLKQLPYLCFVKLHTRTGTEFETPDLLSFCDEFSIETSTDISLNATSYMTLTFPAAP